MNRLHLRFCFACLLPLACGLLTSSSRAQQPWIAPTPEELHMTSIPEVPGAEAVILNRDELDDDDNHMRSIYWRIKVLSEGGVKLGDVELEYDKRGDLNGNSIGEIVGRTIQPDGTIIPFTGKPHDKLLHKDKENAYTARVFSMPAVQVGSIIEYKYTIRWDDHTFFRPYWIIQTDLYLRKGHFHWKPTTKELLGRTRGGRENIANRITWADSLPKGTEVKMTRLANDHLNLEMNITDVPPFGREEYMPPIQSSRYHVFFYYTPYTSTQDFWNTETKYWNSDTGKFTKVSGTVQAEAQAVTVGTTLEEDKARKLYLYAMTWENTDFTRKRSSQEERDEIKSADDVLKRKRGSSDQIAMTYVALARAAGLQASTVAVTDRSYLIFDPNWMDMSSQLTDLVAVVHYGNADHFLDPGSRYAPFGHLEWNHTLSAGFRQDNQDKAKMFLMTPGDVYKYSRTSRVADLKLEGDGHMTGTVTFTYEGNPALRWRHVALRNDTAEVKEQIGKEIEDLLPGGTHVEVRSISDMDNGEVPLKVIASVDGHIGNAVGSRVMLPGCLFEANRRPTFPHETREQGVYFPYTEVLQDAVRYTLPAGFTIEAAPANEVTKYQNVAAYSRTSSQTANAITIRRDLVMGELYFPLKDYPELRTFYNTFETKDHATVVLKRPTQTASSQSPAAQ